MTKNQLTPLISIIIPVYNREKLIADTLNSMINQSYFNWECIIVDDGSGDNTVNTIENFCKNDLRFIILSRPHNRPKGANSCRNYGFENSNGNYVLWADSDDIIHPNCLEFCINIIHNQDFSFCRFSKTVFFDNRHDYNVEKPIIKSKELIDTSNIIDLLSNTIPFNTCTVLWKRDSIKEERFSEDIFYGDEWEFFSRLISNGLVGLSVDTILYFVRKHKNSTTYEFWRNDAVRLNSKIEASKKIIKNLSIKGLLNRRIAIYFVSLSLFLKEKEIYVYLIKHITVTKIIFKIELAMRYYLGPVFLLIYKFKKNRLIRKTQEAF